MHVTGRALFHDAEYYKSLLIHFLSLLLNILNLFVLIIACKYNIMYYGIILRKIKKTHNSFLKTQ
jgi:hypothetical protein